MTSHAISLFDQIVQADKAATVFLNCDMGSSADAVFWALSSKLMWVPVALIFLYLLAKKKEYDLTMKIATIVALAVTIALCDQMASAVFKPIVARLRPSHDAEVCALLHYVNGYRGGSYGFMSSHAANSFGAAVFGMKIIRDKCFTAFLFIAAALVSYSRIYLGVHFLGDVVCGAVLGMAIAFGVCRLLQCFHMWHKRREETRPRTGTHGKTSMAA